MQIQLTSSPRDKYHPPPPRPWLPLTASESESFLERLTGILTRTRDEPPFTKRLPITNLRAMPLSFYPGWLLVEGEAQVDRKRIGTFDVLYGRGFMWVIDGTMTDRDADQGRMSTRVAPVEPGTRPELAEIESSILAERGRISLLYQVLLNSAPIAEGWEKMLTAVRNRSSLPASLRELVMLRVAVLNRAPYEFDAHVPHAEHAGVPAEKIAAVKNGQLGGAFAPRERLVLELADAMTREISVPDALFERLRGEFDERGLVDLVATVAAYNMVSRFLVALNIGH